MYFGVTYESKYETYLSEIQPPRRDPNMNPAINMDCDHNLSDFDLHTKFHWKKENQIKCHKQYETEHASYKIIQYEITNHFDDLYLKNVCLKYI